MTKESKTEKDYAGTHVLVEFWGSRVIEDPARVEAILLEACKRARCNPLKAMIHKFEPQGVSGVVLLEESHIAMHSWPERDYLGIDLFTCGDSSLIDKAIEYLKQEFAPDRLELKRIDRGKF